MSSPGQPCPRNPRIVRTSRHVTSPQVRLVALVPQPRQVDAQSGTVLLPCGLFVVQLPFAEDLRELRLQESMAESDFRPEELEASRALVSALQLPAAPIANVPNPQLHKHFSYLRALATNERDTKPTVDGTLPNAAFLEAASAQIRSFGAAFELPNEAPAASGGGAKKPKVEKVGPPQSTADWIVLWQANNLSSQTAPVLKAFCKEKGLPLSGKKVGAPVACSLHGAIRSGSRYIAVYFVAAT